MKTPIVNANSKLLVPGLPGHQAPVKAATRGSEKRKTDTKEVSELVEVLPGLPQRTRMVVVWVQTWAGTQLDVEMMDALNPALQQLTIAERIGEMELSGRKGGVAGAASLQTDSFAVLLVQGLESSDAHILNVSALPSLSGSL